jgi:hypothetical protein
MTFVHVSGSDHVCFLFFSSRLLFLFLLFSHLNDIFISHITFLFFDTHDYS